MARNRSEEDISVGKPGYLPPESRCCRRCGKVMRPTCEWRKAMEDEEPDALRFRDTPFVMVRVWFYGYKEAGSDPGNTFCTLRCGYYFAMENLHRIR